MPKRYRIEMSIYHEKSNKQVATRTHPEKYESEEQAKERFEKKVTAAREAGKGSS